MPNGPLIIDPLNVTDGESLDLDAPKTEAPKVEAPKTEAPKVEAPKAPAFDASKDSFSKEEVTAIVARAAAEARREARASAKTEPVVDTTVADRLAALENENKQLKLKGLADEFGVDLELFEDSSKTGAELRAFVEKLSKLRGDEPSADAKAKTYREAQQAAQRGKISNLSPAAQSIANIVRRQRGEI